MEHDDDPVLVVCDGGFVRGIGLRMQCTREEDASSKPTERGGQVNLRTIHAWFGGVFPLHFHLRIILRHPALWPHLEEEQN